jgi:HAD superfamily hydrolase (TIGR01457 family)
VDGEPIGKLRAGSRVAGSGSRDSPGRARLVSLPLRELRGYLVDLDGVVYTGDEVIPGAPEFFKLLRERGTPFLLITNNSSRRAEQFAEKLTDMGIPVRPAEVLTSAQATAEFLAAQAGPGSRAFVIGEEGLRSCLERAGFELVDDTAVDYVVVGLDRGFNYAKLTTAIRAVAAGARFVGSNPDVSLPVEDGLIPGAGAFQAAISAATGVKPLIVGKPEPPMIEIGLRLLGCGPAEAGMIGDRLDTDIAGGQRVGMATILVLTGVSTATEAAALAVPPDYVLPDLVELGRRLRAEE